MGERGERRWFQLQVIFMCPKQGPASTRYSTRTRIFLSYSNSTRTKHYSDRVASSKTPRISTIIQKQPARIYFRIITANPDIQKQPSMGKMSSDLHVREGFKNPSHGNRP